MQVPTVRFADHLDSDWELTETAEGHWVRVRPLAGNGEFDLLHRLSCAWLVFTGQCDVLAWKGGQSKKEWK